MAKTIVVEKNISPEKYNFVFIMIVVLLVGIGFTVLYSGSLHYAQRFFDNPLYFISKQFFHLLFGLVGLFVLSFVDLEKLRGFIPIILIGSFILILLPFVPGIGVTRNGASRWIRIASFNFQPSEFIKIVLIVFLANFFDKHHGRVHKSVVLLFPPFIVSSVFIALIYLGNDFSTSMFLFTIVLLMFFIAGTSLGWFVKVFAILGTLMFFMVTRKTYRVQRLLSFFFPSYDPLGIGYQSNAAIDAVTNGGVWGMGLGNGIQKISSVPEIHSDFIFVVWAEEMGFIGVCLYAVLIFSFLLMGLKIAMTAKDRFGSFVAFGATSSIFLQSFLNCAVVGRLLPSTGISLPFFSFGGSSLFVTLCLCGLIINISSHSDSEKRRLYV